MAKLLQNREQNIEHVGIYIAEHRTQFPCIAGALEHHIAGVKHRSVWLGLMAGPIHDLVPEYGWGYSVQNTSQGIGGIGEGWGSSSIMETILPKYFPGTALILKGTKWILSTGADPAQRKSPPLPSPNPSNKNGCIPGC